jgi:hypothetical protein
MHYKFSRPASQTPNVHDAGWAVFAVDRIQWLFFGANHRRGNAAPIVSSDLGQDVTVVISKLHGNKTREWLKEKWIVNIKFR